MGFIGLPEIVGQSGVAGVILDPATICQLDHFLVSQLLVHEGGDHPSDREYSYHYSHRSIDYICLEGASYRRTGDQAGDFQD